MEYYEDPDYIRCHEDRGLYMEIDSYLSDIPKEDLILKENQDNFIKINNQKLYILSKIIQDFGRFTIEELLDKINYCIKCYIS